MAAGANSTMGIFRNFAMDLRGPPTREPCNYRGKDAWAILQENPSGVVKLTTVALGGQLGHDVTRRVRILHIPWAVKGFLYPSFGAYVSTLLILGPHPSQVEPEPPAPKALVSDVPGPYAKLEPGMPETRTGAV